MNSNLNIPRERVYCDRSIIFKKYDKQISNLVRLDYNSDILPKEKGYFYTDGNGNKRNDVYYIDMSTSEFIVYNEDLKMCGNYDYNKEELHYHKLPLNKKVHTDLRKLNKTGCYKTTKDTTHETKQVLPQRQTHDVLLTNEDDDILLKIALLESLNDLKCDENIVLNEDKNMTNIATTLSGIKAEERLLKQQPKYIKQKQKPRENKLIFQDEEIRKQLG